MNAATKTATLPAPNGHRPALVLVKPQFDFLDQLMIAIGMKQLTDEKPTSPLEWNGKVVGLTVSLLACLTTLVAVSFWAATLSADLKHVQEQLSEQSVSRERLILQRDAQIAEINKRLQTLEIDAKVQAAGKK